MIIMQVKFMQYGVHMYMVDVLHAGLENYKSRYRRVAYSRRVMQHLCACDSVRSMLDIKGRSFNCNKISLQYHRGMRVKIIGGAHQH